MRSMIVDARGGRVIVNALSTGEVSLMVDCGRGTMGAILTPLEASELCVALISVVRKAKRENK